MGLLLDGVKICKQAQNLANELNFSKNPLNKNLMVGEMRRSRGAGLHFRRHRRNLKEIHVTLEVTMRMMTSMTSMIRALFSITKLLLVGLIC